MEKRQNQGGQSVLSVSGSLSLESLHRGRWGVGVPVASGSQGVFQEFGGPEQSKVGPGLDQSFSYPSAFWPG